MRLLAVATASLAVLGGAVAQSPTITVCSTAVVSTVTSPSSLCTVTPCAACDNGNYVPSQVSRDSLSRSSITSKFMSYEAQQPVTTYYIYELGSSYANALQTPAVNLYDQRCVSQGDLNIILNSLRDAVDQVDQLLQDGVDRTAALVSFYDNMARQWIWALLYRIEYSHYYIWLSQGCVDWSLVDSINSKIDALYAKYPSITQTGGLRPLPHLKSPCRNVLEWNYIPSACLASACSSMPVSPSMCASCDLPASSVSLLTDNLAVAASGVSRLVAYATTTPFTTAEMISIRAPKDNAEVWVLNAIPQDDGCYNNEQTQTYLRSLTSYYRTLTWAMEQYPVLEYAYGGPSAFYNNFASRGVTFMRFYTNSLQYRFNGSFTCYDCSDAMAYNAAIRDFFDRYTEYMIYTNYPDTVPSTPQLQLRADCTVCPVSSVTSIMSSKFAESDVSSAQPTDVSSDVSSVESTEVSTEVSSAEPTDVSSDVSSTSSAEPTEVSFDVSSTEATALSSALSSVEPTEVSSDLSSAEPSATSDLSAVESTMFSDASLAESTKASSASESSSADPSAQSSVEPTGIAAKSTGASSDVSSDISSSEYRASSVSSIPSSAEVPSSLSAEPSSDPFSGSALSSLLSSRVWVEPTSESSAASEPPVSSSESAFPSITVTPSVVPSVLPATSGVSVSGYFNISAISEDSTPPGASDSAEVVNPGYTIHIISPTREITVPCELCGGSTIRVETTTGAADTATTTVTGSRPGSPANTFTGSSSTAEEGAPSSGIETATSTKVVIVPCHKCPGGITTVTTVTELPVAPSITTLGSVRTTSVPDVPQTITTTTAAITTICPACPGGKSTYLSTGVATVTLTSTGSSTFQGTDHTQSSQAPSTGESQPTQAQSTSEPGSSGSIVPVVPSVSQTVVAANFGTKKSWSSLVLLLIPALFGL